MNLIHPSELAHWTCSNLLHFLKVAIVDKILVWKKIPWTSLDSFGTLEMFGGFYDFLHLYQSFYSDLPESIQEFKALKGRWAHILWGLCCRCVFSFPIFPFSFCFYFLLVLLLLLILLYVCNFSFLLVVILHSCSSSCSCWLQFTLKTFATPNLQLQIYESQEKLFNLYEQICFSSNEEPTKSLVSIWPTALRGILAPTLPADARHEVPRRGCARSASVGRWRFLCFGRWVTRVVSGLKKTRVFAHIMGPRWFCCT